MMVKSSWMPLVYDKSGWEDGPWKTEPDIARWRHVGMECCIVRHPVRGHLCGYVGLPPDHPFYEMEWSDVDGYIRVHGGVTLCIGEWPLTTAPKEEVGEDPRLWWIGFDTTHGQDYAPGAGITVGSLLYPDKGWSEWNLSHYRNFDYVRKETNDMAEQLYILRKGDQE